MLGLMQGWPLLCHQVIDHAATFHGGRKVITRSVEGPIVETTYSEVRARSLKVASGSVTASQRSPGTPGGISNVGTASWGSARSITP
jgi:hypothetical protein